MAAIVCAIPPALLYRRRYLANRVALSQHLGADFCPSLRITWRIITHLFGFHGHIGPGFRGPHLVRSPHTFVLVDRGRRQFRFAGRHGARRIRMQLDGFARRGRLERVPLVHLSLNGTGQRFVDVGVGRFGGGRCGVTGRMVVAVLVERRKRFERVLVMGGNGAAEDGHEGGFDDVDVFVFRVGRGVVAAVRRGDLDREVQLVMVVVVRRVVRRRRTGRRRAGGGGREVGGA